MNRAATLSQVNRAEALGLIDRKEIGAGERVALTDLGWKLFGLDDEKAQRRAPALSLPDVEGRPPLVQLLIHWPVAVALVEELADHLGRNVEAFWDEVLDVERSGDVETWPDHPAGPAVMLSALASDSLGLSLSADGTRWLRPHDADPTSIDSTWEASDHFNHVVDEAGLGGDHDEARVFDQFADPESLEGWRAASLIEAGERRLADLLDRWTGPEGNWLMVLDRKPKQEDVWEATGERGERRSIVVLPEPTLLLGQGLLWPTGRRADGTCPACGGARLGVRTYCLVCSRSGLDDVIREILRRESRPSRIRAHRLEVGGNSHPKGRRSGRGKGTEMPCEGLLSGLS